jgi:hypothetical protein
VTEEEKRRIVEKRDFYHVTKQENLDSIMSHGLSPRYWDPLAAPAALERTKEMKDDGLKQTRLVVLKIPADAVAQHECDVDYSFRMETEGLNFIQCLEKPGMIVCYGTIPPAQLEVVELQDEQGHWSKLC